MKCVIEKVSWSCNNYTWRGEYSDESVSPCKRAYQEDDGRWYVDIASIDQLKDLIKEVNEEIIISIDETEINGNDYLRIRIYDNYVE